MARRLAAILAADVAGYTKLMSEDEAGTLAALRAHRSELFDPAVTRHGGRTVKLMGDGALVEFTSVVEAVECAIAIQESARAAKECRLQLRIGINLGDVIAEGDDIYGDGVNVAARLQALAEPGGIVISAGVHDQIRRKVAGSFTDLGSKELKNVGEPVQIYAWTEHGAELPTAEPPRLALPDKPSIAVVPFTNMSGDPEQEFFSDGITEDIITELSRYKSLFVVARNSSFVFRGRAVDIRAVGAALGVQFVLEGSVRKAANRIRVTAQLINSVSGDHVWADRFDGDLVDVFALQDEISRTIVSTIAGRMEDSQAERLTQSPTHDLTAYEHMLRGQKYLHKYAPDAYARARECFELAVSRDPKYARAHASLALVEAHSSFWDGDLVRLDRALQVGEAALALDPHESKCHLALGFAHLFRNAHEKAGYHLTKASELNPNDDLIMVESGRFLMYTGRPKEGAGLVRQAMRRNPYHPNWYWNVLGRCLHTAEMFEDAIPAFERIEAPQFWTHVYLAACHAASGRHSEAEMHAAEATAMRPDFSISGFARFLPYRSKDDLQRFLAGLRRAPLPA